MAGPLLLRVGYAVNAFVEPYPRAAVRVTSPGCIVTIDLETGPARVHLWLPMR